MKIPHLMKKRQGYYAYMDVPARLRPVIKKTRITCTLSTRDLAVALRRLPATVEAIKRQLGVEDKNAVEYDAVVLKRNLAAIGDDDLLQREALLLATTDELERRNVQPEVARAIMQAGQGETILIREMIKPYLEFIGASPKTAQSYERNLNAIAEVHPTVGAWTRKEAASYLIGMVDAGKSASTVQRDGNAMRGLWKYLHDRGDIGADIAGVWVGIQLPKAAKAGVIEKRAYTDEEVKAIHAAAKSGRSKATTDVAMLVRLLHLTGARTSELVDMKADAITKRDGILWLDIRKSKTDAGVRSVPVTDTTMVAFLESMKSAGRAPFEAVRSSKADKNGSRAGKASRLIHMLVRNKAGIADEATSPSHSFRHRAVTRALSAGFTDADVKVWAGHAFAGDVTRGRYGRKALNVEAMVDMARLAEEDVRASSG